MRIALLEDDHDLAQLMLVWMDAAGHTCAHFDNGERFISALRRETYDMLILDWCLPDIGGDEVLGWVRQNIGWDIPVIFVTLRDSPEDIVSALERGADDYMVKPVQPLEMLARITALARRTSADSGPDAILQCDPFQLDTEQRELTHDGNPVTLTQREFELAVFLFRNAGRMLSRAHILESVWGRSPDVNTRTVDTHISRLRKKLGLADEPGWRLSAIYNHGYRLERVFQEGRNPNPAEQKPLVH